MLDIIPSSWFNLNRDLEMCSNQASRAQVLLSAGLSHIGRGKHKDVFRIDNNWVLKVGSSAAVARDTIVWLQVHPERAGYYARTAFSRFLEIQELGIEPDSSWINRIKPLRSLAKQDGIWDIRRDNVRQFASVLKIIDGRPIVWPR